MIASSHRQGSTESVGERLRRLRLERGLSHRELASGGVSYAYISRIESGTRSPSVRAIRVLARSLGVTPDYLETGVDLPVSEALELRLGDAELQIRIGEHGQDVRTALLALLKEARAAGEQDLALRAQIALGLAAFSAGDNQKTVEHLAPAVEEVGTTPLAYAGVYVTLAKAYRFLGRAGDAVDLLERALDQPGDLLHDESSVRVRFATYLSYALTDLGEFERARAVLIEASEAAPESDPRNEVRLHWSLARLAYMEGTPRLALREIRRAIVLLDHTEDTLELARAHLFAAEVHLWQGDIDAAAGQLRLASDLQRLSADQRDLGSLRSCEALVQARHGNYSEARALATEALAALADSPAEQGAAWLAFAVVEAAAENISGADEAYSSAVDSLLASSMLREAASVCSEWAALFRRARRTRRAQELTERALDLERQAQLETLQRKRG